jgi:hypothetical protein
MASIHVRLRADKDDDIAAWYEAQDDKSTAVREAIRAAIDRDNGQGQEAAVKEAVGRELARLPQVVTAAVREALEDYQLSPADNKGPGSEDPELASRLDAQLDEFFS